MQEIWTRDDMKYLKTFTEQAHKSILLPSQSVLPNLIQFYFYPKKLITSTLIIRLPCCGGHLWGKWKSTAGNRIWPLVTAMIMKTIGNLNPHWENQPPLPTIFSSSIFTQPNSRGWQHRIANFCFVLSWCTVEAAAAIVHKTDQKKNGGSGLCNAKYLVLNQICSISFSKYFQWFYINSFFYTW